MAGSEAGRRPGAGRRIARGKRPEAVYEQLRDLIVRGRLAPGSPLIETDIAARLGVSRTPARSALQQLHQEGLIVSAGAARLFKYVVAPLTRADGESLYQIIAELDGLAASQAARLPAPARRQLGSKLRQVNDQLRKAGQGQSLDGGRLHELDRGFHRLYLEAAGTPRLQAIDAMVSGHEDRYARLYFLSVPAAGLPTIAAEHDAIVDAIVEGDAEAARRAARTNWLNAAKRLAASIETLGEQGGW